MKKISFVLVSILIFIVGCTSNPADSDSFESKSSENQFEETMETTAPEEVITPTVRNDERFHTVEIKEMKFVPEEITVHKGDTVLWINNDMVGHDVTDEKNKTWTSGPLAMHGSWKTVITKDLNYYCSIHMVMKGKITVK